MKPVHRRLLYAMSLLNLTPEKGFKKSARVVGDVIDPYGDAIKKQFSTDNETWTESFFRGSADSLQRIFGMQTSK